MKNYFQLHCEKPSAYIASRKSKVLNLYAENVQNNFFLHEKFPPFRGVYVKSSSLTKAQRKTCDKSARKTVFLQSNALFPKRTTRATALHALQQQSAYCVTDNGKCMDNALGKIRLFVKLKHKKRRRKSDVNLFMELKNENCLTFGRLFSAG